MRLPPKKKPGDPVLATDWNLLMEAVAARTPCAGSGLEFFASSGGFSYSAPQAMNGPDGGRPPFSVIAIEKSGDGYLLTIKEGWVIERPPPAEAVAPVRFRMPVTGGTPLDEIPRPQIAIADGDTLYCKIRTNSAGTIIETPEIVVASTDPGGTGQGDFYHVKLLGFTMDDDGIPQVTVYQQSDIEHWAKFPPLPFQVSLGDTTFNVEAGWVAVRRYGGEGSHLTFIKANGLTGVALGGTQEVWCEVQTEGDDIPSSATIAIGDSVPDSIQAEPDGRGYYYYRLARIETSGDPPVSTLTTIHVGGCIQHTPNRIPPPPETGIYVLSSQDGVLSWLETMNCEDVGSQ